MAARWGRQFSGGGLLGRGGLARARTSLRTMDKRVRMLLLGAFACAVLFALILVAAYGFPAARRFAAKALQGFLGFQRPSVNRLTDSLHTIGNPLEVVLIGAGLALIAVLRGRPRTAVAVV